jgi:hypothetical protein
MNFAYDIDFSAGTVALWYSTGSSPLTQVHAAVSASPSTNSADWHIGVLRLPNGGTSAAAEDYYWSGVYVESGSLTTSIAGPNAGSAPAGPSTSAPGTSTVPTTSTSPTSSKPVSSSTPTSSAPSATGTPVAHYGQCGGIGESPLACPAQMSKTLIDGTGWTGSTLCASGFTCTVLNSYYSQVSRDRYAPNSNFTE